MKTQADKLLFYKVSLWSTIIFVIVMVSAFGYTIYQFQVATKQSIDRELSSVRLEILDLLKQSSSEDVADKILALNKDITNTLSHLKDSVVAFNSTSCPEGWKEYKPAYGRFIRGIDRIGSTDPDGLRRQGSLQSDAIQTHIHGTKLNGRNDWPTSGSMGTRVPASAEGNLNRKTTSPEGARLADETRPKNVALLYCIKQ